MYKDVETFLDPGETPQPRFSSYHRACSQQLVDEIEMIVVLLLLCENVD